MKKFLCSTLISLLVITPGLSTSAFADTNYSINTIESLEETLEANKDSINKYQLIKKSTCSRCPIHCYKKDMKEKIKDVMKFSGPRLIIYKPSEVIRHALNK